MQVAVLSGCRIRMAVSSLPRSLISESVSQVVAHEEELTAAFDF